MVAVPVSLLYVYLSRNWWTVVQNEVKSPFCVSICFGKGRCESTQTLSGYQRTTIGFLCLRLHENLIKTMPESMLSDSPEKALAIIRLFTYHFITVRHFKRFPLIHISKLFFFILKTSINVSFESTFEILLYHSSVLWSHWWSCLCSLDFTCIILPLIYACLLAICLLRFRIHWSSRHNLEKVG